jgi:hypothetical protein
MQVVTTPIPRATNFSSRMIVIVIVLYSAKVEVMPKKDMCDVFKDV